jgi:uracil-DNA glycosylase
MTPPRARPHSIATAAEQHVGRLSELRAAVNACRRCSLWQAATQGVPGEGRGSASLMLIGETPGDAEDLAGHPFVGPAGGVLNRALSDAGIDRSTTFVTNAVRHFKFEQRGKRRLHVKPSIAEVKACLWWLSEELRLVRPKLAVALGATATRALLGRATSVASVRGRPLRVSESLHAWVTIHPSYLLRIQEEPQRRAEYARFVADLKGAREWLEGSDEASTER